MAHRLGVVGIAIVTVRCTRLLLLAVLGVALGAVGGCKAERSEPEAAPEPRPDAPRAKRKPIQARSQNLTFEQLQALGYVDGIYDPKSDLAGVTVNKAEEASPGYNFYSSRSQTGAQLIDMDGRELHRWDSNDKGAWQHAELLPDGDVLVIVKDERLSRYDKDSKRIWSVEGRFHHDLWTDGDEIYALARVVRLFDHVHRQTPTLVDVIQVRTLDGELKREISILDAIHDSEYRFLLPRVSHEKGAKEGSQLDVLHSNHVEVFDGRLAARDPIYAKGNILVSMRNINAIAILDGGTSSVVWLWGPNNLTFQHHPTLLDNGHILLFDNGVQRSRVIEIDPLSLEIVWEYAPKSGFFSKSRGSNQRLANGNTLITDSDRGYVLEVTPGGEVVWKFANPAVHPKFANRPADENKMREAIWRMTRIQPETLSFLD